MILCHLQKGARLILCVPCVVQSWLGILIMFLLVVYHYVTAGMRDAADQAAVKCVWAVPLLSQLGVLLHMSCINHRRTAPYVLHQPSPTPALVLVCLSCRPQPPTAAVSSRCIAAAARAAAVTAAIPT
jgi:hypothetical protein